MKAFDGHPVVRDLEIDVEDGELFVLVGPSGSGKTTLLRMIAGLEQPDAGSIRIGDADVTHLPPNRRNVGMVFQSYALFPHLSAFDNIAFGLVARGADDAVVRERVTATAASLGIGALLDRLPRQLSGGERQRVALGRALVREPDVLLMDEPLSNLDAQLRAQARGELLRLQQRVRTTTIYVTHDQIEALGLGHRVAVLREGLVEQVGTPQEIYDAPASVFVGTFIGSPSMNLVPMRAAEGRLVAGSVTVPAPPRTIGDLLVGVRPEHVHVQGSRWSGHARPGFTFDAVVETVESAGDQVFLTIASGDVRYTSRVEPSFLPAPGTDVRAWLDPDRVHLFDVETERRISS